MRFAPVAYALCSAIALAVAPARLQAADPPADRPMAVTTDTAEYCATLARLAGGAPNPPADARRLLVEGKEMCDRGEIRGGIARLRRALVVERHRPRASSPAEATQHAPAR